MTTEELLSEMAAKGMSAQALVMVAKLTADAEATEKMRAAARERMRIVRERSRTLQNGSEHVGHIKEKKERKKGRKTVMPDAWHPAIAPEDLTEFQRFVNYCKANAKVYADWDAAWRNWQTSPYRNGGQNGRGRRHGSVLDAADRLRAKLNEQGSFGEDYIPGSSGPEPLRLDQGSRSTGLKLVSKG